jgi:hypothetical protein
MPERKTVCHCEILFNWSKVLLSYVLRHDGKMLANHGARISSVQIGPVYYLSKDNLYCSIKQPFNLDKYSELAFRS